MIKTIDIAWLAGILEGEGYFNLKQGKYPQIGLDMTSEDIVTRVSDMWDTRITRYRNRWITQVRGAYAIQWMMTLYPFLGKHRREAVVDVIKFWRGYTYCRPPIGMSFPAVCHPDRVAKGPDKLCVPCYDRKRWEKRKLLKKAG